MWFGRTVGGGDSSDRMGEGGCGYVIYWLQVDGGGIRMMGWRENGCVRMDVNPRHFSV